MDNPFFRFWLAFIYVYMDNKLLSLLLWKIGHTFVLYSGWSMLLPLYCVIAVIACSCVTLDHLKKVGRLQNAKRRNQKLSNESKKSPTKSHGSFFNYSFFVFSNGTLGSQERWSEVRPSFLTWKHTIHDDEFWRKGHIQFWSDIQFNKNWKLAQCLRRPIFVASSNKT